MQLKYKAVRLGVLAAFALSGAAVAQTNPPANQTSQTPSQNPPGPVNPTDQSTAQSPPPDTAGTTGVPGGTSARPAPTEEVVGGAAPAGRQSAQEEIVVTGSRVRRKDLTTPAPVTVINKEQIQSSGIASIGDFLQQMPEQAGGTNTNVNNGGSGETAISLRNLGAQRTLVLVDGKRWVNGASGGLGQFVDLNSIPTAAIERVEVLKDGASAVYGSDAIGGVVNIITRRRVNGVELSAYGGTSGNLRNGLSNLDAQQYDFSVTAGAAGDKGSFMFSAGYFKQESMLAASRNWAALALGYDYTTYAESPGGSSRIPAGRASVDPSDCASVSTLCADLLAAYGAGTKNFMYDPNNPNPPTKLVDGWRRYSGALDPYNYQAVNYLITPSTRYNLFSNGDFHISDSARAYFQGSFVNRQSSTLLAPEPFDLSSFTGQSGTTLVLSGQNAYNPFKIDVFDVRKRMVEYSGRQQGFDINTVRAVVGVDGTLPSEFGPLQGVFWDVSFNYGRNSGVTTTNGSLDTTKVANAVGPSYTDATGLHCGTDPTKGGTGPIPNCTPANLFGNPSLTPAMITSLGGFEGINEGFNQIAVAQANISAELIKLASERPIGLAAGYEFRSQYGGYIPNAIAQQFNDSDYSGAPTSGSYHVNEVYGEVDAPIIGGIPFAEDVEVQGAIRAFKYSTFGSDYTYKVGGRWRPIRDVTFRGTYSTGFRAPDVTDLYGGRGPSAELASDPCAVVTPGSPLAAQCAAGREKSGGGPLAVNNGDDNVQINSTIGGNPNLKPEKAKIATVGVVIEPQDIRGLSATVDYWNIQVSDLLQPYTTSIILGNCYPASIQGSTAQPDPTFCNLIQRSPDTGKILNVFDYNANSGRLITSGFDFALRYGIPTDFGRFGLLFDATYLINYNQTLAFTQPETIHSAGNYDSGVIGQFLGGVTPKVKFNAGVNYGIAGLNAGLRSRFIGGYDECADNVGVSVNDPNHSGRNFCSEHHVDANGVEYPHHGVSAYVTFDAFASYLLRNPFGSTTFSLGIRNLANQRPPRVYNSALTYADPAYDLVGRFVYGRITHNF